MRFIQNAKSTFLSKKTVKRLIGYIVLFLIRLYKFSYCYICVYAEPYGDAAIAASLARAKKEQLNIRKCCVITHKKQSDLISCFHGVDSCVLLSKYLLSCIYCIMDDYTNMNQNFLGIYYGYFNFVTIQEVYNPENFHYSFVQLYKKYVFDLPITCCPEFLTKSNIYIANNHNKVLLAPYANTVQLINENYWDELVRYLLSRDYTVFTNTIDNKVIKNTYSFCSKWSELPNIINEFDYIISIRSGFCDFVSLLPVNLLILYPSDESYKYFHLDDFECSGKLFEYVISGDLLNDLTRTKQFLGGK